MCRYNLGLFSYCPGVIATGLKATQTGEYVFTFFINGKYYTSKKIFSAGDELLIDTHLNEYATIELTITNPDGSVYSGVLMDDTPIIHTAFYFQIQLIPSI